MCLAARPLRHRGAKGSERPEHQEQHTNEPNRPHTLPRINTHALDDDLLCGAGRVGYASGRAPTVASGQELAVVGERRRGVALHDIVAAPRLLEPDVVAPLQVPQQRLPVTEDEDPAAARAEEKATDLGEAPDGQDGAEPKLPAIVERTARRTSSDRHITRRPSAAARDAQPSHTSRAVHLLPLTCVPVLQALCSADLKPVIAFAVTVSRP